MEDPEYKSDEEDEDDEYNSDDDEEEVDDDEEELDEEEEEEEAPKPQKKVFSFAYNLILLAFCNLAEVIFQRRRNTDPSAQKEHCLTCGVPKNETSLPWRRGPNGLVSYPFDLFG